MTGKSFLLHKLFPNSPYYDLLRAETFLKLSMRPQALREELEEIGSRRALQGPVIIDEIQKLPLLLDEVHSMIEDLHLQFILTGSSARKIKRRGTNLLGGRAWTRRLHPLCSAEIGDYNVQRVFFRIGGYPPGRDAESLDPREKTESRQCRQVFLLRPWGAQYPCLGETGGTRNRCLGKSNGTFC